MSDVDSKLLHEMVLAAYRDVNPDLSSMGAGLCRKLSDGLYARGARVQIGAAQPTTNIFIHHSLDPLGNILWTCRRWNQAMGVNSRAPIGRHISNFLDEPSYEFFKNFAWPELIEKGKISEVPLIFVSATRDILHAMWRSEILRDERGGFLRTFAKLKVTVPASLARMAS